MDGHMQIHNYREFYSRYLAGLDPAKAEQNVHCIFHDDQKPSLSINLEKGTWYCHAEGIGGGVKDFKQKLGLPSNAPSVPKTIVAEYDYHDEHGNLLFQTVRYLPKDFKQRRPDGKGGWIHDIQGVRRVLYRLPELLRAQGPVIIVEGEKDADVLYRHGFVATTNPMGAGKWRKGYNKSLQDRDVIVMPDNDTAGKRHGDDVSASLLSTASTLKLVVLPDLAEKEDVSDWFGKGHTAKELQELIAQTPALTSYPGCEDEASLSSPQNTVLTQFPLTDLGNAERVITKRGEDLRYCESWKKWLTWNGRYWTIDSMSEVMACVKNTVRTIYEEAAKTHEVGAREKIAKHAISSEHGARIREMVGLARHERAIQVLPANLDVDPFLFNVQNGTVDLRTGGFREHRRSDLLTLCAPVFFSATATCPQFETFLAQIFGGNQELVRFIQRVIGYCLTGTCSEQCLFFLYGTGSNGKTTLIASILSLLGPYAMQAPPDLLLNKRHDRHPTELADLCGRRFVATVEADRGRHMAESLVKQLTGGDRVRARRMKEDFWEFEPTHKIFLAANHNPVIRGTDHGIWRRIHRIPFTVTFRKPHEPQDDRPIADEKLVEKLYAELPGILNWAIEGCLEWQNRGLQPPAAVLNATQAYREEMDVISNFTKECCVRKAGFRAKFNTIYGAYKKWCEEQSEPPVNAREFGNRLAELGIENKKIGGNAFRIGLGLLDTTAQDEQDDQDVTSI